MVIIWLTLFSFLYLNLNMIFLHSEWYQFPLGISSISAQTVWNQKYGALDVVTGKSSPLILVADKNTMTVWNLMSHYQEQMLQVPSAYVGVLEYHFPSSSGRIPTLKNPVALFKASAIKLSSSVILCVQTTPCHSTLQNHKTLHDKSWFVLELDKSMSVMPSASSSHLTTFLKMNLCVYKPLQRIYQYMKMDISPLGQPHHHSKYK